MVSRPSSRRDLPPALSTGWSTQLLELEQHSWFGPALIHPSSCCRTPGQEAVPHFGVTRSSGALSFLRRCNMVCVQAKLSDGATPIC